MKLMAAGATGRFSALMYFIFALPRQRRLRLNRPGVFSGTLALLISAITASLASIPHAQAAQSTSPDGMLNPMACGAPGAPAWCSGSDVGGWINAAYRALPSSGGEIYVPATGTCLPFATPIEFATYHKQVTLRGAGNRATCLRYAGTGTAITVNVGVNARINRLEDFALFGPGPYSSTTGMAIGGAYDNGTNNARVSRILINSFGLAMELKGPNTFMFVGDQVQLNDNKQNLLDTAGQENNRFLDSVFSLDTPGATGVTAKSVEIAGSSDWSFIGCSFDNVQLALSSNASVRVIAGHFENPGMGSYDYFASSGLALELVDVMFQQDRQANFSNGRFGSVSRGLLNIVGGTAYSAVPMSSFVTLSGTANLNESGLYLDSGFTSGVFSGTTDTGVTLIPMDNSGDASVSGTMVGNNLKSNGNILVGRNVVIPAGATGYHGSQGAKLQFSDGTGQPGTAALFAADGSLTGGGVKPYLSGTTDKIEGTGLAGTCTSGVAKVPGAAPGMPVVVSSTSGADVGGSFQLRGSVTSPGTVIVNVCGAGTPPALAYNVRVIQ